MIAQEINPQLLSADGSVVDIYLGKITGFANLNWKVN